MDDPTYIARTTILHNGKKIEAGTQLTFEDNADLRDEFLRKRAVVLLGSPEATSLSLRGRQTTMVQKPAEPPKGRDPKGPAAPPPGKNCQVQHLFAFSAQQLAGKSLDDLNTMILERDSDVAPYETPEEARAHLMKDATKD